MQKRSLYLLAAMGGAFPRTCNIEKLTRRYAYIPASFPAFEISVESREDGTVLRSIVSVDAAGLSYGRPAPLSRP